MAPLAGYPMRAVRSFVAINRRWSHGFRRRASTFFDLRPYGDDLRCLIERDIAGRRPQTIIEVGGIDRPLLEKDSRFRYVGVDVEDKENCREIYDEFIVRSIEKPLPVEADILISKTLMEHVRDNGAAVRNMYAALNPGGRTFHYIPSKWHPYSMALRLVTPTMQRRLIPLLRPGAEAVTGYPAFFDHCSPPAMRQLFQDAGFRDVEVTPYYRAHDYFAFFFPAFLLVSTIEYICKRMGWSLFCSGFIISATRPARETAATDHAGARLP